MLKALALLAAVGAVGPVLFRAAVWRPALAAAPPPSRTTLDEHLVRHLRPVTVAAAAVLTAASLALLLGLAYTTAAGSGVWPGLGAVGRSLAELVAETRVGLMTVLRVAAGPILAYLLSQALAAPQAETADRRPAATERLALLAGGCVLLTFSVGGHAVDTPTQAGVAAAVLADLVHFAAACFWGGGLLALALAPWRRLAQAELVPFAARLVQRFSTLAALAVLVLLASGVLMASQRLYGILALFETRYGLDVVWKLALLVVVLFFAKDNLLTVRPGLARAAAGGGGHVERLLATLRTRVLSEGAVLVLILLVAGFLTVTPPPWRQPREMTVVVHPDRYDPAALTWPRSRPVRLVLENRDTTTHSFVIDGLRYEGLTSHVHGFTPTGTQFVLYAPPRQTVRAVLTPLQSGTFRFYDALQDFAERGLEGTVQVR